MGSHRTPCWTFELRAGGEAAGAWWAACAAVVEALGGFAAAVVAFAPMLLARMTILKVWIGPSVQG